MYTKAGWKRIEGAITHEPVLKSWITQWFCHMHFPAQLKFFWTWPFITVITNTCIFKQSCAWFAILSFFLSKKTNYLSALLAADPLVRDDQLTDSWSKLFAGNLWTYICLQSIFQTLTNDLSEHKPVHTSFTKWRKDCFHWVVCSLQFVQHWSVW